MTIKNKDDIDNIDDIGNDIGSKGDVDNEEGIPTFRIAATYIGTVIGAGFAGLLLATLIFVVYGYIILKLGFEYQAKSHL